MIANAASAACWFAIAFNHFYEARRPIAREAYDTVFSVFTAA
jgi:hypothetical protein